MTYQKEVKDSECNDCLMKILLGILPFIGMIVSNAIPVFAENDSLMTSDASKEVLYASRVYKEAISGNPEAQFLYAQCAEFGLGIKRSLVTAHEYYEKAAIKGNAAAQYKLGEFYNLGIVVEQSDDLAFIWFQKAAEQGHVEAMFEFGICYFHGYGTAESKPDAIKWWLKAAKLGHPQAKMSIEDFGCEL